MSSSLHTPYSVRGTLNPGSVRVQSTKYEVRDLLQGGRPC